MVLYCLVVLFTLNNYLHGAHLNNAVENCTVYMVWFIGNFDQTIHQARSLHSYEYWNWLHLTNYQVKNLLYNHRNVYPFSNA